MTIRSQPPVLIPKRETPERPTLIVLCHLRWGFVFQRPQHLLTRLARRFDVVFVEEPVFDEGLARLENAHPAEGVEVLTPRTPSKAPGFHDEQLALLQPLLEAFVEQRGIRSPVVWLYTPMALPLVEALQPRALVYDCMDDLASFKFAPSALAGRERFLLELADVVLTGGPSLYEARRATRPDAVCLPSAVDIDHFAPANLRSDSDQAMAAQALHAGLHAPRIGFYGVVDERLDLELVAGVADARLDFGGFVDSVNAALEESAEDRARRSEASQRILERSTWNVAAAKVLERLAPHLDRHGARPASGKFLHSGPGRSARVSGQA